MNKSAKLVFLIAATILAVGGSAAAQSIAENWHQWRGPEHLGVSRSATPPLEWGEEQNIRWKVAIDGNGSSCPIIWGDKVFILTAINTGIVDPSLPKPEDQPERVFGIKFPNTSYDFVVICLDRRSGEEIWRRTATRSIPHEGHHKDNNFASASPITDGKRLYCWFGSEGLFCYDLDGNKIWQRDLGEAYMGASLGEGCSPALHDGKLIIVRDHSRQSTIEVLDAGNGETLWRKDRDEVNAWATPAVVEHSGHTQIITSGSNRVRSYDLDNGEIIWECGGLTNNCAPCPVVEDGVVYCMSGYKGYSLLALPLAAKGDITGSDAILWSADKGTPYVPSPILYDGSLWFTQSNQGILSCLDAKTGRPIIERSRLPGLANIYASPVGADGRIYFAGRDGTTLVLERGKELKVLAANRLDDQFIASPALAGKQLFLRGRQSLYCLEEGARVQSASKSRPRPTPAGKGDLLTRIEATELPAAYNPGAGMDTEEAGKIHQAYVDQRMAGMSAEQKSRIGQLWKEKQKTDPGMHNRGASFVKIMEYVAENDE